MREHVKPEVALEIISVCFSVAIKQKDCKEIAKLESMKRKIYEGDTHTIEIVLNEYGPKVKEVLEGERNVTGGDKRDSN
ncbi:MAG: hypothetical protein IJX99_07225 [Clostridia bacterium]|nr:hypothetical protein [Clostridia bacterium]